MYRMIREAAATDCHTLRRVVFGLQQQIGDIPPYTPRVSPDNPILVTETPGGFSIANILRPSHAAGWDSGR